MGAGYRFFLASSLLFALGACGDDGGSATEDAAVDATTSDAGWPDSGVAPALYNARDDLSDNDLATQALALLGLPSAGGSKNCQSCHGLTRQNLYYWRALSDTALSDCLTDLNVSTQASAKQMIDCFRIEPSNDTSLFRPQKVGIFDTAAHLDWFRYTFQKAYEFGWENEFDEFLPRVGMPRGGHIPFTQPEFDIIATWFARGLPLLEDKIPPDNVPTTCTPGVSSAVAAHVADLATSGWRAVNTQNNLLMYGCSGAATALDCLTSYPRAGDDAYSTGWEANVPGQVQRVLRQNDYVTAYWTRSSADGRYVAAGIWGSGSDTSRIVDLQRDFSIPGNADYDPGFFPDNSGFVFQGNNAYLCNMSLLDSEPTSITYQNEAECTTTSQGLVGLYQHVGAALNGGDYWAISGQFTSDTSGTTQPHHSDPSTGQFGSGSAVDLTPIINTGGAFQAQAPISIPTPYEGDHVLSPSASMVVSRQRGPNSKQLGYVMRQVIATPNGGSYDITLPEVARYCINGGKPAFSYDERWLIFHHYINDPDAAELGFSGPNDPGFADYRTYGASNIYLLDTLTGNVTRITNMHPGQYALYPHFRSDGWIYFNVRNLGQSYEYVVASDAALRLE